MQSVRLVYYLIKDVQQISKQFMGKLSEYIFMYQNNVLDSLPSARIQSLMIFLQPSRPFERSF